MTRTTKGRCRRSNGQCRCAPWKFELVVMNARSDGVMNVYYTAHQLILATRFSRANFNVVGPNRTRGLAQQARS